MLRSELAPPAAELNLAWPELKLLAPRSRADPVLPPDVYQGGVRDVRSPAADVELMCKPNDG